MMGFQKKKPDLPFLWQVIDAAGHVVVPGFVDIHEHITGGGGEAGPASRTVRQDPLLMLQ